MGKKQAKNIWLAILQVIRFYLATIAIKFCGLEMLYWAAPTDWEKYMSKGEPMTLDKKAEILLAQANAWIDSNDELSKEIDNFLFNEK